MGTLYSNTFNICVTWMPAALIFFATCAINNFVIRAYDVVNAFMEEDPPCDNIFVVVDQQLSDYYRDELSKNVPVGWVVPVLKSLQGHPEAGRMFDEAVHERFTNKIDGYNSKVEPSFITHKHKNGTCGVTLRQVDDFAVATADDTHHE